MTAFVAKEGVQTMNALTTTSKVLIFSPFILFPIFSGLRLLLPDATSFWFAIYIWQITVLIIIMKE